ncbi:50S ribosomal protein L25/general stress protein Ctc [Niastella yeongjuensis]|uniref:Large ribosomal subunit protein bL25 n=1 Tax=Niastella yeongjuensis TaxID=354355 RepID=A0A1V9FCN4_9BACT|nr:50S ribosomal protein L25 [Niastella yeongjuensis]OQP55936.1 50S ribosomal protein L25/general stress protein Ctc [Niastella yeongjuensis]SEP26628.1 large subunit ribosomal protein L25 [Niastella yeongjuensis]
MKTITIEGQLRTETGKKATRQIRSQGLVPGVIYGGTQEVAFSAPVLAFKPIVYTPDFLLVEVNVAGKSYKCILKDLQFDKVSDSLSHVDFLELVQDRPVIATIPVKFTGTSQGVKDGGRLITKVKSLKVKSLPQHLKENIEVDITTLELNGNIRVEDVNEPNYEILNSPRIPIASVVMTRQLKQEEAAAPAAAKGAAPKAAAPAAAAKPAAKK